jgi:hypothetical protein
MTPRVWEHTLQLRDLRGELKVLSYKPECPWWIRGDETYTCSPLIPYPIAVTEAMVIRAWGAFAPGKANIDANDMNFMRNALVAALTEPWPVQATRSGHWEGGPLSSNLPRTPE